jgi:hypothetical protein
LAIVAASFFDGLSEPGENDPTMAKARYYYNIMLRPEPERGPTAIASALPGCVTYGRTVDRSGIPSHNRDLPNGTLMSWWREAGFAREERVDFLAGR